jgi:RND superfamily putative drug exporter
VAARLATLPTARRASWLFVVLWLALAAFATPLAAKLTKAENNEASAFLPRRAESTRVLDLQRTLPGGDSVPIVVVLERPSGITSADRAAGTRIRGVLERLTPAPTAFITSPDNRELLVTGGLAQTSDADAFTGVVKDVRRAAHSQAPPGARVAVTGPAGLVTDTFDTISGIERTLLIVAATVVAVTLLVVYRSPVLWLVPLGTVAVADQTATGMTYLLARHAGLTVNAQSAGILRVLVFGAGTDYALLLISRYREELTRHRDDRAAMRAALTRAGPALLASAATVVMGLLCLLLAELSSDRGLGPVGAVGITCAFAAMVTLLPTVLAIFGRRLFWPFVPRYGVAMRDRSGIWVKIGNRIAGRPRTVWITTSLLLGGLVIGLVSLTPNLRQDQIYRHPVESVTGAHLLERSFPAGATAPTYIVARAGSLERVRAAAATTPGVATVLPTGQADGLAELTVVLAGEPDGPAAYTTIREVRRRVRAVPGADALVGGTTAVNLDIRDAAIRDRTVVIPVVLAVIAVVLGLLLRSVVAPVLLIATVLLSFLAALGASAVVFTHVLGFAGTDPSLPLFGFIFLVALGIDYNIFLMTRVREEAARSGPRDGVLGGLAVTGGVITSAGAVLAATFSALLILPLVLLAEVGFLVAFGVLLDTFVVRSVLVPALALDVGPKIWWPGALSRRPDVPRHH